MGFRTRLARLVARPSLALFALLLGCYAYFYQAGGWNQNSRFDLVRSMVEDRALDIDRFEQNTHDQSVRGDHHYCDKAPGASWLCVPTYAAIYYASGAKHDRKDLEWLGWASWLPIVLAISLPSALAALFLARLMTTLGAGRRAAWATALGWALATMALPYSTLLYGNQLAASLLVIAFALLVEIRHGARASALRMAAVGGLVGLSLATEYPAALIAIPIAGYALRFVPWRSLGWGALAGAIPLGALAWYHQAAFGSPLAFPYDFSVWPQPHTGWFMGIGTPDLEVLKWLLVGGFRGLWATTPWLALGIPGAVLLYRARHRAEMIVCSISVLLLFWLNSSIPPWHGGWAAGPRYLVPMLPFFAVLAGGALIWVWPVGGSRLSPKLQRLATVTVVLVLAYSGANMFAATAVKPEIDLAWQRPYLDFVWPNFIEGKLAVSQQSLDNYGEVPVGLRPAWNLGMKLGLTGLPSLLPLVGWVLVCGVWWRRANRAGPLRAG